MRRKIAFNSPGIWGMSPKMTPQLASRVSPRPQAAALARDEFRMLLRNRLHPANSTRQVDGALPPAQCVTFGSVETLNESLLGHGGWPKPLLLMPVPPSGFGVMSKMMLSGWFGSPAIPPST